MSAGERRRHPSTSEESQARGAVTCDGDGWRRVARHVWQAPQWPDPVDEIGARGASNSGVRVASAGCDTPRQGQRIPNSHQRPRR